MYASDVKEKGIQTTIKPSCSPSCFDCMNCEIVKVGQKDEYWCCETVGWGMPCKCDPPYDEPCNFFSKDERFDNNKFYEIITAIQSGMDD